MRSKSENGKTAGAEQENGPRRHKVSQDEKKERQKNGTEQQAPAGGAMLAAITWNEVWWKCWKLSSKNFISGVKLLISQDEVKVWMFGDLQALILKSTLAYCQHLVPFPSLFIHHPSMSIVCSHLSQLGINDSGDNCSYQLTLLSSIFRSLNCWGFNEFFPHQRFTESSERKPGC